MKNSIFPRSLRLAVICVCLLLVRANPYLVHAQSSAAEDWQKAAGGKVSFDVASVKRNTSGPDAPVNVNMPIGPGDYFAPTGGLFRAVNLPVGQLIAFAYKMTTPELHSLNSQLPKWANADRFDIDARGPTGATKDQMRLMVQSLLADRFKFAIHIDTHEVPVFAAVLAKEGRTGAQLHAHATGTPCSTVPQSSIADTLTQTVDGKFPVTCGGIQPMQPTSPGRIRFGARNVAMADVVSLFSSLGHLGRPVLDETGLGGKFDFSLEFVPQPRGPTPNTQPAGPTFLEALQDQLGLKLESTTGPVEVMVLDHIEEPLPN